MRDVRRYAAGLQRHWAADALRDEKYNLDRARHVRSPFLQKVYRKEAALDDTFRRWRLRQAKAYLQ